MKQHSENGAGLGKREVKQRSENGAGSEFEYTCSNDGDDNVMMIATTLVRIAMRKAKRETDRMSGSGSQDIEICSPCMCNIVCNVTPRNFMQ